LKKDDQDQYVLTRRAIENFLNELEQKFRNGEISAEEYNRQKSRLSSILDRVKKPQFKMTTRELADTVMEMMDARDNIWNDDVSLELMNVYYRVKENREGAELTPPKRNYYALKRLIDDMEKREILKATEKSGFMLTSKAVTVLLQYLIHKDAGGGDFKDTRGSGKVLSCERNQIRRYSSGDIYRDISVRHTLKGLAQHRKPLSEIRESDLRVYLKESRKPQSDIIVCLDTSGSMGFHHKMLYGRLVSASLVQSALEEGDNIGLVAFNNYGQVTASLTGNDRDSLLDLIASLRVRGNTNIGDGLACSTRLLFENHNNNLKNIVLITDGQPTAISERDFSHLKSIKEKDLTEESALLEAKRAAAKGVRISVVHIADKGEASGRFIRDIARIGQGRIRYISGPDDLKAILH
jgi:Mg-chelatase subunit ChlD